MTQALGGGDGGWQPLDCGVLATEVSRTLYMTIVITISGSGWVRPTSSRTPPDELWLQVGPPQPAPPSSLPSNSSAQPAWQPAHTGSRVANNMAHINRSGGAALSVASGFNYLFVAGTGVRITCYNKLLPSFI